MQILIVSAKTVFFYFYVVLAYRIMGKREVGQLGIIDLIVSILIAELVAISIENSKESILLTIIPITLLVILEIFLALVSVKSRKIRRFLGGKPSLIICKGKINYKEIIKQRYNMDDLLMELRLKEIKNIDEIEYAFLETNGELSIFKYNPIKISGSYPMPLILDGEIQDKTLKYIKKSKNWLNIKLQQKKLVPEDIFYAFYQKTKIYIIKKADIS